MKVPYRQNLELSTSGGDIRFGDVDGATDARTSGGSIKVEKASGAVQAQTSGGSIHAGFVGQPSEHSELRTSGGGITVHLRDDMKANLDASALGGGVTSDCSEAASESDSGWDHLNVALNGGGPDMVLKTSGGSIRIRRSED